MACLTVVGSGAESLFVVMVHRVSFEWACKFYSLTWFSFGGYWMCLLVGYCCCCTLLSEFDYVDLL